MQLHNMMRSATVLLVLITAVSCRPKSNDVPATPPNYQGQISGQNFDTRSSGVGELSMLRLIAAHGTDEIPSGFARIDGSTKFVSSERARIRWTEIGLPDLRWAHVRVWYHMAPTSVTATEIWGNARLVMVDSAGTKPP